MNSQSVVECYLLHCYMDFFHPLLFDNKVMIQFCLVSIQIVLMQRPMRLGSCHLVRLLGTVVNMIFISWVIILLAEFKCRFCLLTVIKGKIYNAIISLVLF